jgi:hypothetical protein
MVIPLWGCGTAPSTTPKASYVNSIFVQAGEFNPLDIRKGQFNERLPRFPVIT